MAQGWLMSTQRKTHLSSWRIIAARIRPSMMPSTVLRAVGTQLHTIDQLGQE